MFAPQKVFFLIFDDVIACDLWFGLPQLKILATPVVSGGIFCLILLLFEVPKFRDSISGYFRDQKFLEMRIELFLKRIL